VVILIVEDDGLINLMASDDLKRAGYDVMSVYSADEAIRVLESRNDIWLIFTDIDLPGSMDGLRLAAAVGDRWPPIHIIITTGHVRPSDKGAPQKRKRLPTNFLAQKQPSAIFAIMAADVQLQQCCRYRARHDCPCLHEPACLVRTASDNQP
jgi:two-component system, response regulator PdtaR